MFCANEVSGRQPNRPDTVEIRPSPAMAPAVSRSVGVRVQAHLGQRGGVTQHLDRGDDVEQADGDDRAPVELRLERHELRHGHDGEVLETGEIDLAHADSRHIADHQTEQHGQLLGRALHQQLERQAGNQRYKPERQVLPGTEVLGSAAAAEARGTHVEQREADRRDHDGGDDGRHEPTPILGRQTQHKFQQTADHYRADHRAIALVRADRHGGRHVGEGDAGDHRKSRADEPRAVQLQASAQARNQQAGLDDGGRLGRGHLRGRGDDEDRGEVRHEHGHHMLQAERNALPEGYWRVQRRQRLKGYGMIGFLL